MSVKMRTSESTKSLVLAAVLTAVVVVLQVMAIFTRAVLPMFAINLVLIPIVIGAAMGGIGVGAWLGFVSGIAVLISGDATAFLQISPFGTIVTVLAKGVYSGLAAAAAYKLIEKYNKYVAVVAAALACPIVNTGVFVIGSLIFFMKDIREWGTASEYKNAFAYIFLGMIGINFIIELSINVLLSPVVVRLLNIKKGVKAEPGINEAETAESVAEDDTSRTFEAFEDEPKEETTPSSEDKSIQDF